MKVFANYLPQFHQIPENDQYWGKGFTDWVSCKNAKPLFPGHQQPKKPLNDNYYSLDNVEAIRWQAKLAKKYGISGFAIYHYWFHDGLNLLTTPPTLIRENKDIDIEYFFIWDNKSWKKTWSALTGGASWTGDAKASTKTEVLAELVYGREKEWKAHFNYLLPFFKDDRYLKVDNKPVFALFTTYKVYDTLMEMWEYWNKLAKENGFDGVEVLSRADYKQKEFANQFIYTPFAPVTIGDYVRQKVKRIIGKEKVKKYDYDSVWRRILKASKKVGKNTTLSGFVDFDDTPRRGNNGNVVVGATPEKFEKYFSKLLDIAKSKGNDVVLLTAWNEWGEGCYLEPDTISGYEYLEALKRAIDQN